MEAKKIRDKIKKGELKTKKKEGQKSSVWLRFSEVVYHDETSAGYVICNGCEALYVYDSHKTGTSNMVHHVCAKGRGQPSQTNAVTPFFRRDSKTESLPVEVKSKFVDDCVDFCCLDMRPFDIFAGKGFLQVAQTLINIGAKYGAVHADAVIPDRQTVSDRAKQQAAADKEKLFEVVQKVTEDGGIAVTPDVWTDEFSRRAYTVLTCHYISDKWHLESRILATVEFDSHLMNASESIHDQITNVLMNYGISAEKVVFVGDQVPYIKDALRTYHWVPCAAHVLNTVLMHTFSETNAPDGISDVVEMLDNCKSLVTFLKRTGAFRSLSHIVIQDCEVRWTSQVHMLESILKHYTDISKLLKDRDQLHRMEGIFQEQLTHLIEFLTLFKLAINELEGERYPTVHTVLLWFLKLKKHCEPKFGDPTYMVLLRARASSLLEEEMLLTPIHKVATFLCPRFRSLKMLTLEDRQEVMGQVRALINEESDLSPSEGIGDASSATGQGGHVRAKKQKVDFTEWEDETPKFMDEVEEYCSTNFQFEESSEENLLSFWEKQDRSFPRLQHLARRILCIPATSTASERSFGAAKARQNRLNPGTVDAILFLHSAKKKLK